MGAVELIHKKTGHFTIEDDEKVLKATSMLSEMESETDLTKDKAKAFVSELRQSTECERGTLFLIDREKGELFSLVAEGLEEEDIHLSLNLGIAGLVAITCQELNIQDAYADPRFDKSTDEKTGYHTRNILCVPLMDQSCDVIGVVEVKIDGIFCHVCVEP